jgi:asparagine synthase (glutamine-hydrolysing)
MSGIAGMIEADGHRPPDGAMLRAMAAAMRHRGPDGEAVIERGGLGLIVRRLALVDLQAKDILPANEDQTIFVAFQGLLTNAPQLRAELEAKGHRLASGEDAALVPHLWEERQEGMFERLKGQFALALWDERQQRLLLARDRFGICPLHWTRLGGRLLFASEIKAMLASGLVEPRADPRGISQIFTCFGLPGPVTCFQGISALLPGHYLDVRRASPSDGTLLVRDRTWWEMGFPDRGRHRRETDAEKLLTELEQVLLGAIERRLRADVPVAAYSSGGLDSSLLVTMARRLNNEPLTTFTFRLSHPGADETKEADIVARHVGNQTIPMAIDAAGLVEAYPRLVLAAESPVVDTSAAALLLLAAGAHEHGFRAVLSGEGSDEWLAGYPWFRIDKQVELLNLFPGVRLSRPGFRLFETLLGIPRLPPAKETAMYRAVGGHNAWMYAYFLMSSNQLRFFSEAMLERLEDYVPLADLGLNLERMSKWDPLNRSLYIGARVHLTGLHLNARGDRSTMHSSVQSRFPFLDEEVFDFLANLAPHWKMRGYQVKTILRLLAERWLPPELTRGRKRLIHAPLYNFHHAPAPAWMQQLVSPESLEKTGYFKPRAVADWRRQVKQMRAGYAKLFIEMGLVGVISTQLWHHLYLDPTLCELPGAPLATMASA